ncbi:MAG: aminomethyltransferase family protein [Planctomycetes bacterium]|nr:aminomethyltransferase family protein [Planctomycetota bacterium]
MRSPGLADELVRHRAVLDGATPLSKVAHFGDPAAEAAAAFASGVVRDQSARARLRVRGKDRHDFVQRMCTNDVKRVAGAVGLAAAFTNAKGRLLDLVRIAERGEELLLLGSDGQAAPFKAWLEKHVVMEELELLDAAESDASLLAFGPRAEAAVRSVLGELPAPVDGGFGVRRAPFAGGEVVLLGMGAPPLHSIELVAPAALAGPLFARLVEAGLAPIGEEAWSQVRVEAGIPQHGREIQENANPLEAGLLHAVSFQKGCYIGQEVVARLNSYAKVQRHLVGVRFPASVDPAAVNEIFWDLLRVGNASSVARSPRLDATVALAFVKSEYSKPGTPVYTVRAGERFEGTLCEVPFR